MDEPEIGVITHYFPKVGVAVVKASALIKNGDKIHVKGHTADFIQVVESMQVEHVQVAEAKSGDEIGMKMAQECHEHDKIYKA